MSKVKELNELVIFGCRLSTGIFKAVEDKKFTVSDMGHFISPLMAAGDAFEDAKFALDEVKKLDVEGIKIIENTIQVELQIPSEKAKKIVKKVIISAMAMYASIREIVELAKITEDVAS